MSFILTDMRLVGDWALQSSWGRSCWVLLISWCILLIKCQWSLASRALEKKFRHISNAANREGWIWGRCALVSENLLIPNGVFCPAAGIQDKPDFFLCWLWRDVGVWCGSKFLPLLLLLLWSECVWCSFWGPRKYLLLPQQQVCDCRSCS